MTILYGKSFTWHYKGKRKKYYQGMILCACVDGYGSILWTYNTGIDRLNKIDAINDAYIMIKNKTYL